jgi:hypothetical protein
VEDRPAGDDDADAVDGDDQDPSARALTGLGATHPAVGERVVAALAEMKR